LVSDFLVYLEEAQANSLVHRLDPIRDHGFYEVDVIDRARKETYALFDIFDKVMAGRKYLVGDRLSIGDIMVACVVGRACKFVSPGDSKSYSNSSVV
jgi:glutathione S-transferase